MPKRLWIAAAIVVVFLISSTSTPAAQAVLLNLCPPGACLGTGGALPVQILTDGKVRLSIDRTGLATWTDDTNAPISFGHEAMAAGFPVNSNQELLYQNTLDGSGVLALKNNSSAGYSAITFRDLNRKEYLALGYGHSGVGPVLLRDANFLETWTGQESGGTPKVLRIMVDGDYGSTGSGYRFYQRQSFETDGSVAWWQHIPSGTTQVESMKLLKDGGLGIGMNNPAVMLHVQTQNSLQAAGAFDSYGSATPAIIGRHALGSVASPTQLLSGNTMLQIAAYGYQDTGGFASTVSAAINFVNTQDITSANHGGRIDLRVVPNNSTTPFTAMQVGNALGGFVLTTVVAPAATGTRYLCISTGGVVSSSASACSGT